MVSDPNFRVQKNGKIKRARENGKFTQCPTFEADNGRRKIRYRGKNLFVSRIVYAAHGPQNLSTKKVIDHIDRNTENNSIQNLQQITQAENIKKKKSESRFSEKQVRYMRKLRKQGLSYNAISRIMHRPTRSVIYAIKNSKRG